jgi:hypothetical protein
MIGAQSSSEARLSEFVDGQRLDLIAGIDTYDESALNLAASIPGIESQDDVNRFHSDLVGHFALLYREPNGLRSTIRRAGVTFADNRDIPRHQRSSLRPFGDTPLSDRYDNMRNIFGLDPLKLEAAAIAFDLSVLCEVLKVGEAHRMMRIIDLYVSGPTARAAMRRIIEPSLMMEARSLRDGDKIVASSGLLACYSATPQSNEILHFAIAHPAEALSRHPTQSSPAIKVGTSTAAADYFGM